MTVISINNLSLSFGMKLIIQKLSFALEENDRLGIIGVNGCGKSTLFKLITGEYEPDEGNIYISKDKTVGILRQDGAFEVDSTQGSTALEQMYAAFPELIAREARLRELEESMNKSAGSQSHESLANEYSELYARFMRDGGLEFRGRCASILQKMGYSESQMNQSIETLSGGQRTRLALSRQLCREPDILLLDEPTNHLDIETLAWLESFLSSYKKCVMVISHDRYFLDRVTNKTLALEHCTGKLYNGGYSASMEQRRIDREIAEKHYKIQQKEIARQEAYIAQQRAWNRERNIIAAESRQKLLDKMVKLERPKEAPKPIRMKFHSASASGNEVLKVRELSKSFGEHKLFEGLDFLIKKSERAFIVGPNGCGKSTLIKIILDKVAPTSGYIEAGYNVEVGYYDQENQNLTPENTVLDELWNAYPTMKETEVRNTLALFRFVGDDVLKEVSVLSGGERARLTLAKLILSKMNLLILDEPTNHLDIPSREALETALSQFDGTILTVSHDRYFIDRLATRIIEMKPGELFRSDFYDYTVLHEGEGFTEYKRFKADREAEIAFAASPSQDVQPTTVPSGKEQYLENKRKTAEARKEQKRLERLRGESEALESELENIEKELYGDAASNYVRAAELEARRDEIEERLLEIYEIIGL